ncbi:MAG: radical SAM protein [Nitrospiraceae bacterium]|nr:radical SAM protein [Nitrospiraceae bacterium]
MKNILLISPVCGSKRMPEVYNIGLAYLASVLVAEGHKVDILDLNLHSLAFGDALGLIRSRGRYDAIGIGSIITTFRYVRALIEGIKRIYPDIPVWVGNSVASTIPELFLKNTGADVVVIGEGEITAKELAADKEWADIRGIAYWKNGVIVKNPPRETIEDLDTIPFPAYYLFDAELYMLGGGYRFGKKSLTLGVSSRGCPYKCTYCYHAFQGMKVRYHSPERMISEVENAMRRYTFDIFTWADDLFISSRSRVIEFCDLLEELKIKKKWNVSARVNLVDEDLLKRMKSAGCILLSFGVESGSQKILDNIRKRVTVEQNRKALELCRRVGIDYEFSLMTGNVGEDRGTVRDTVELAKWAGRAPSLFIATPYPGTELYDYGLRTGKIVDEIALIESYSEQSEKLLVNFSNMSDEELLTVKRDAEKEMKRHVLLRNPLSPLRHAVRDLMLYVKLYGYGLTFLRGIQKIVRALTGRKEYKLRALTKRSEGKVRMFE